MDEHLTLKKNTDNSIMAIMIRTKSVLMAKEVYVGKEESFISRGDLLIKTSGGKYYIFNDMAYDDLPTKYHRIINSHGQTSWSYKLILEPNMELFALTSTTETLDKNRQPLGYPKKGKTWASEKNTQ